MKLFSELFTKLDQTTKTNDKVAALATYFDRADNRDKMWTMALLSHRRPKRTVNTTLLRTWAASVSKTPLWLFEESYHVVGDLAETIALILPPPTRETDQSLSYWVNYIKDLGDVEEEEKRRKIIDAWSGLNSVERFVFNKLITGGWRIGVSQKLMVRALAKHTEMEENVLAHRLMGNWTPETTSFEDLLFSDNPLDDLSKPYPFYLAHPLEEDPATLGATEDWMAERKWDGIRGQLIVRKGKIFVWSRGEELVTAKFPEFEPLANILPGGTVIDGEILPFKKGKPLSFQQLQTRVGRKNLSKKILEKAPVIMMAYDLLEWQGKDLRDHPMAGRRKVLENLFRDYNPLGLLKLSPIVPFTTWPELEEVRVNARQHHSEGLMLKRKSSIYKAGRKRGDWWKWKVDPFNVDAVMIYAQRGHGRRANLYTDFTFAVWDDDQLVPFTKAYSGLTDKEFREINAWIRKNTLERFGPVRSVKPALVFEIAFEGINESNRHKSGVALRFPRIKRWRRDKPIQEANTLTDLKALLNAS